MVETCSTCVKHKIPCTVKSHSWQCEHCDAHGRSCNVKVTQSEFRRLIKKTRDLELQIDRLEAMHIFGVPAERKPRHSDMTHRRASKDMAAESSTLEKSTSGDEKDAIAPGIPCVRRSIQLSPFTWDVLEDVPDGFWESGLDPALLASYLAEPPSS